MENSERLSRQARPRIEPGISCLPVLRAEPLGHWWDRLSDMKFDPSPHYPPLEAMGSNFKLFTTLQRIYTYVYKLLFCNFLRFFPMVPNSTLHLLNLPQALKKKKRKWTIMF